jgi:quinol monooxygenase YgiN
MTGRKELIMCARVTTTQLLPERISEFIRYFHSVIVPSARQQPGFTNLLLLVDHHSGKCLLLSLWESAAQRQATGATSAYLQAQIAPVVDFLKSTPVIEEYAAIMSG